MIPKITSANKYNNTLYNTGYSTPPQITPSFGSSLNVDKFVKTVSTKFSLEEAIAQIPKSLSMVNLKNPKNIPIVDDADIWGNLHNMVINIEKLAYSDGYIVSLSNNNPDGSTGFIGLTHGSAEKIKADLETPAFIEKFKKKFEKFSWHFNDEPEVIDLNG